MFPLIEGSHETEEGLCCIIHTLTFAGVCMCVCDRYSFEYNFSIGKQC